MSAVILQDDSSMCVQGGMFTTEVITLGRVNQSRLKAEWTQQCTVD